MFLSFFGKTPPPPQWTMDSSFTRFLDHTQRRTTVSRTPLDEWSARRRDLYLTKHNTHNRQTSMPPGWIRTHNLSRRASTDPRLLTRSHWDPPVIIIAYENWKETVNRFSTLVTDYTCCISSKSRMTIHCYSSITALLPLIFLLRLDEALCCVSLMEVVMMVMLPVVSFIIVPFLVQAHFVVI